MNTNDLLMVYQRYFFKTLFPFEALRKRLDRRNGLVDSMDPPGDLVSEDVSRLVVLHVEQFCAAAPEKCVERMGWPPRKIMRFHP